MLIYSNYVNKSAQSVVQFLNMVHVTYYLLLATLGVVTSAPTPQFNNDETSILQYYNENNGLGQYNYL